MDSTIVYAFCQEYGIAKLNVEYKTNELSRFGINVGVAGEATCKLEMPQDLLYKLIEDQTATKELLEERKQERLLRDKYESVKKAYDEYQLLLTLTQKEQENEF